HQESRKEDVAADLAAARGHEREHDISCRPQIVHQLRLGLAPEGVDEEEADRRLVSGLFGADDHRAHVSPIPLPSLAPRRKSSAAIGLPPARCNSRSLTAPSPQAIPNRSSMISPGAPFPSATVERRSFTRSGLPLAGISHQAPGTGESPRMWLCTS